MNKLTTEEFVYRAKKIHGELYDYTKTDLENRDKKGRVCIICHKTDLLTGEEHGEFWQTPGNHLKGKGCAKCKGGVVYNTDYFIKKANKIHGAKYDYSKTDLENRDDKGRICVICHEMDMLTGKEHGEFWQTPGNHLKGKGCAKCKGGVISDLDRFLLKARLVHGDKYNYEKTIYKNSTTPITITCVKHGDFTQVPPSHLNGSGCPQCWDERRGLEKFLTQEAFLEKAKKVHGDKYVLSSAAYERSNKKVKIICPTHGAFYITPNRFLSGGGCKECGKESARNKRMLTTEEFISRAKLVHGKRYDYSKTDLKKRDEKGRITITCRIHGDFKQKPNNHLIGKGCIKCAGIDKMTTDEFIRRSQKVHGDKYDYSKTNLENRDEKGRVIIICPIHGEFLQFPGNHIRHKMGCKLCNESHLEKEIEVFLKENNIRFIREQKFKWLGRQRLDFYLPDFNTAIECQGRQHFWPDEFFGGEEELKKRKELDKKKYKLCNEHGIAIYYYVAKKTKATYEVYKNKKHLLTDIKKAYLGN